MAESQTMKGCDDRYIPVVKAIESTNMWIKIVSAWSSIAFITITTLVSSINLSIKNIEISLNDHKLKTMWDVSILKTEVENLKLAIKK